MRPRITAVILLVIGLTTVGCNWIQLGFLLQEHKRTVPAEFSKLQDHRVLTLVWAEPETLFDYPHVRWELSSFVGDKLRAEVSGVTLVDPVKVEDHIQKTLGADADPEHMGRQFEADMVVYLELTEFQIRDPEVPDLVQARIGASVAVYDLTADPDGPQYHELAPVHVTEPEGGAQIMPRANMLLIRQEAYSKFAESVARKFYSWEEIIE